MQPQYTRSFESMSICVLLTLFRFNDKFEDDDNDVRMTYDNDVVHPSLTCVASVTFYL
jgi:hypothetical protein